MMALAAGGSAHTSRPLITTWPPSGRSRPVIIDSDVVFPAPFGPTSPAKEPAAISRPIPATASFAPKLLRSACTAMAGSPMPASYPWAPCPHAAGPGALPACAAAAAVVSLKTDITMLDTWYQQRQAAVAEITVW
jgi:hypothetical protein